jgi:hypothetical protein
MSFGAEDGPWHEPNDDSVMQNAMFKMLSSLPCYICGVPVAGDEGWRRGDMPGLAWCPNHQPVWSRASNQEDNP